MTSPRIKLQLFPINDSTQTGLEKDGYNPHLELTLRLKKKISSVIKHINNKWGNSSVAVGELILFPYEFKEESGACYPCWNSNNDLVTAEHVHSLMGNPSVFRLRYGWCPEISQSSMSVTSVDFIPKIGEIEECAVLNTDITYMEPARPEDGNMGDDVLWICSEHDVSVSDLFNEASLQGRLRDGGQGLKQEDGLLQAITFPDSFDASVAAQSNAHTHLSDSRPPHQHSILDRDVTSGEFGEPHFLQSVEHSHSSRSPASENECPDAGLLPSHHSTKTQQEGFNSEAKDAFFIEHRTNEDGGNLDLTGIHWESLNNFDFPLPSPCEFIMGSGGDNASMDFLNNQLLKDDH